MTDTKESAPKLQKRAVPTEYPIFLRNNSFGKNNPKTVNNCIYKINSPHNYTMVSLINGSADFRTRSYSTGVEAEIYLQYIAGAHEYKIVDAAEFEALVLEVNAEMLKAIRA